MRCLYKKKNCSLGFRSSETCKAITDSDNELRSICEESFEMDRESVATTAAEFSVTATPLLLSAFDEGRSCYV